jgi:hypothetical protein
MATAPELPYLAAGVVAMVGSVKRTGGAPSNMLPAVIATVVLVLVTSATTGSRIAPVVRAIGVLMLVGATYGTVRAYQGKAKS